MSVRSVVGQHQYLVTSFTPQRLLQIVFLGKLRNSHQDISWAQTVLASPGNPTRTILWALQTATQYWCCPPRHAVFGAKPNVGICSDPNEQDGLPVESFARTSQFQIKSIWKLTDPLWVVPQRLLVASMVIRCREAAHKFLILFAPKKKAVWFFAATKNNEGFMS